MLEEERKRQTYRSGIPLLWWIMMYYAQYGGCDSLVVKNPLKSANLLLKIKIQKCYINSFSCWAQIRVRQKIIIFREKFKKVNLFPRHHFFCLTRIWVPLRKAFRIHLSAAYFRQNPPIMDMVAVILTHGWTILYCEIFFQYQELYIRWEQEKVKL